MSGHYKDVAKLPEIPVFHLQGHASCGTPAYSNQEPVNPPKGFERFAKDDWYGVFGQCVCFARKCLYNRFGFILPDVKIAAQIFYIPYVFDTNLKKVPVKSIRNGADEKPVKDSFLIYASHMYPFGIGAPKPNAEGNMPGHIAWITDVTDDRVFVADQNRYYHHWEGKDYSASFPLKFDEKTKKWWIEDEDEPVVGWVTFPTASKADLSRYEDSVTNSPKVYPSKKEERDKVKWANRAIEQNLLDQFPEYDADFQRWSWYYVAKDFRPHPALFPFILAYMIGRFMVYYPIKMAVMKTLGWDQ